MDERQIAMKMGGQDEQLSRSSSPQKANSLDDLLASCPRNETIRDSMIKCWVTINNPKYKKIVCSISGGSDSDIMLDMVFKSDIESKVDYVWYDTGLEYQATKEHLRTLENKYGIEIKRCRADKPIPVSCKEFGQPFCSKFVSQHIGVLQKYGFEFVDEPFDKLAVRFPKVVSTVRWWCNMYSPPHSQFNIARNKWLKEFLIANPPGFKVSSKCCYYAKKNVRKSLIKNNKYDLEISGIRKDEGGIRSVHYTSCFDEVQNGCDSYRPLFWFLARDKRAYEDTYGIENSRCYTEYGFRRTGCACCPFGRDDDLAVEFQAMQEYEPNMYKAVNNIFGDSYEYTKKYREFCKMKNEEVKLSKLR